jgi:hypothetical protein
MPKSGERIYGKSARNRLSISGLEEDRARLKGDPVIVIRPRIARNQAAARIPAPLNTRNTDLAGFRRAGRFVTGIERTTL